MLRPTPKKHLLHREGAKKVPSRMARLIVKLSFITIKKLLALIAQPLPPSLNGLVISVGTFFAASLCIDSVTKDIKEFYKWELAMRRNVLKSGV